MLTLVGSKGEGINMWIPRSTLVVATKIVIHVDFLFYVDLPLGDGNEYK